MHRTETEARHDRDLLQLMNADTDPRDLVPCAAWPDLVPCAAWPDTANLAEWPPEAVSLGLFTVRAARARDARAAAAAVNGVRRSA